MSLNLLFQVFSATLAGGFLVFFRFPETKRSQYDRWFFWVASILLIVFVAFRPLGVGVDDVSYGSEGFIKSCPHFGCDQWIQRGRDQLWYLIAGLFKFFYPHPQVVLWLAGIGLTAKLYVIDRLCRYRCLALLFYVSCFYIIHDITALRVSLAISVYLLGFYSLVQGCFRLGAGLLVVNGFFHKQAFLAPLLLLGRWFGSSPMWVRGCLLLPFVLLIMGIYPNARVVQAVQGLPYGEQLIALFSGNQNDYMEYINAAAGGAFEYVRLWPVVVPPTLLLVAWLLPDLLRFKSKSLFCYSGTSLVIAAWLLWGYAIFHVMQLRLWDFFLVPIVFVIGNVQMTRLKLVAILALSTVYLLKYTVMHDLLLDQRQVLWDTQVGGQIALQTPAIACGDGCGFNVRQGTAATLKATPDAGYGFAGWYGACAGADPVCTVTVDGDVALGAHFVQKRLLTLTLEGRGTVTPEGWASFLSSFTVLPDLGAEVRLTSAPADGWYFAGWTGVCETSESTCVLRMSADQAVTARFVPTGILDGLQGR